MKITETDKFYRLDIRDDIEPSTESTSILNFLEALKIPEFITEKCVDGEFFTDRSIVMSQGLHAEITAAIAANIRQKAVALNGDKITPDLAYDLYMLGVESCKLMPATIPYAAGYIDDEDNYNHCMYAIKNTTETLDKDWDHPDRDEVVQYLSLLVKIKAKKSDDSTIKTFNL